MEFLGVSDSRPNSIRAKPGHIACELSSLHPKDIRGIVAESEALRWRMQKYKQLKQTLALMAAKGGLTEDDTERVSRTIIAGVWVAFVQECQQYFVRTGQAGDGELLPQPRHGQPSQPSSQPLLLVQDRTFAPASQDDSLTEQPHICAGAWAGGGCGEGQRSRRD